MKKIVLLFCSFFFILSCDENEEIECFLPSFDIKSNSPVISGNDIFLNSSTATSINLNNAKYFWSGPNGFLSNELNPVLTNATLAMAGEYSLIVKKGICESEVVKLNVEVIENTITCNPNDNTGTFTDLFYSVNYYNVTAGIVDSKFNLRGGAVNSNVKIIFYNNQNPQVGIYKIKPSDSVLNSNEVLVSIQRGDSFNSITYNAKSGDVLISKNSQGKYYAIFCDVPFYLSTNTSPDNYGTVKIIEQ